MPTTRRRTTMFEAIADFLGTRPTREQILAFKPPPSHQRRFTELVEKNRHVKLSAAEEDELDQFEQGELLMQLVKARLRSRRKRAS